MTTGAKRLILFFSLISSVSFSQEQNEKALVIKNIDKFFEGFTKSDSSIIISVIDKKNFSLQTVYEKNNSVQILNDPLNEFLAIIVKPKKEKWTEHILSYTISIDGSLANAWCNYIFNNRIFGIVKGIRCCSITGRYCYSPIRPTGTCNRRTYTC